MNRQTERRAQYSMRIDLPPDPPLPHPPTGPRSQPNSLPASIQIRNAVARSVTSVVPNGADVTMDGSVAVISGTVASEGDRLLVERMALLIPGVDDVRNDLVVSTRP
jgi:osmotically-inducible protein OsmY